ncbi:uncharacterized protein LOC123507558 [Portunus trituberculatus]|uniref:uncharacterized protein LOC123507558 n=1 Tax=Portunus trituberculatus TaxID=210409 RepID=UPI001E1D1565|nr:uncharacterized protein LOC123507558 [Portunus trituberculatus]
MKCVLLVSLLCSWVVVSRGWVLWSREAPQADQPQQDEAESSGTEVLRMVEALGRELSDRAGQEDGWLSRYQDVAQAMEENNKASQELLSVSRMAVPVIWNLYMGNSIMFFMDSLWKGGGVAGHSFSTRGQVPPPPPKFLFVYPTELTADDTFVIQAVVVPTAEANVGFCAYFEPEEGEELDFDNGDIFFASHIRWHFDYGNSREIVFNDRYNGEWSRPEVTVGSDQWPDFTVGEKFIISVAKMGPCLSTTIMLGRDMHSNTPKHMSTFQFCPKQPRKDDPRKLWLTLNEDKTGAGEIQLHWLTWVPLRS